MTDDTMNLQALVGKSADSDFLREMIGFFALLPADAKVLILASRTDAPGGGRVKRIAKRQEHGGTGLSDQACIAAISRGTP